MIIAQEPPHHQVPVLEQKLIDPRIKSETDPSKLLSIAARGESETQVLKWREKIAIMQGLDRNQARLNVRISAYGGEKENGHHE
ncbi:MAG: hypothetical protein PHU25_04515 [Deltaproteobacteria bacterium]|nr:hypothetical protein [Deltaproteobacteria bacterium]